MPSITGMEGVAIAYAKIFVCPCRTPAGPAINRHLNSAKPASPGYVVVEHIGQISISD
jgi:hypothetical protein